MGIIGWLARDSMKMKRKRSAIEMAIGMGRIRGEERPKSRRTMSEI